MHKTLTFGETALQLQHPDDIDFRGISYHEELYKLCFANAGLEYEPCVDVDRIADGSYGIDLVDLASLPNAQISNKVRRDINQQATPSLKCQLIVREFLDQFPLNKGLFFNTTILARHSIANAEAVLGESTTPENFITIKRIIDTINSTAWSRERTSNEKQSGVSSLGTISETLLSSALGELVDNQTFFKVNDQRVQSYGDFVLMCMPNNLWLSVKSNYARERLLASGYSNDIVGVGFFEDHREFTSQYRVRNFQKAGFLAMYCPDEAINAIQRENGTSTYHLIERHHADNGTAMPLNINGKPFIRRLSQLAADLRPLLAEQDLKRRFTLAF